MPNDIIIVAGHICLDIIVELDSDAPSLNSLLVPGKLLEVGPPIIATGGAVSNTGLALHRLGVSTRMLGKLGTDLYGRAILDILREQDEDLSKYIIVAKGACSSYTLVISSPRMDRLFLHHPGANDTFHTKDVSFELLEGARIFHFGYPPLMKQMYRNGGDELVGLLRQVRERGPIISLDMAKPDPDSRAGQIDWRVWLVNVLPNVDIFLPSIDEILYMLDRSRYESIIRAAGPGNLISGIDGALLSELSGQLLSMGPAVVVLKLGADGLYMRTTDDPQRLKRMGQQFSNWSNLEILRPCFKTEVVGTTGSGDCAIAGFLSGVLMCYGPEDVLKNAAAVGAYSVEQAAATDGVPDQAVVQERVRGNWQHSPTSLQLQGWRWDTDALMWRGPNDKS